MIFNPMVKPESVVILLVITCIIIGVLAIILKRKEEKEEALIFESRKTIDQDYEKVVRVIESCKTRKQLEAADKMIMGFKNKHLSVNTDECREGCIRLTELLDRKYSTLP